MEEIQQKVEAAVEKISKPVPRKRVLRPTEPLLLQVGKKVKVRTLGMEGMITSVNGEDAEVQVGNLRVRVKTGELVSPATVEPAALTAKKAETQAAPSSTKKTATPFRPSPGLELDVRGQRAEDALDALDRYIEQAYMSGMPFVRIIHGKGTGRLRQVIREALKASVQVKSFEEGERKKAARGLPSPT